MHLATQDVRLAVRMLAKHPGFTSIAVLSLALAIALNTTMYGVLDALIFPRLAMHEAARLHTVVFYGDYRGRLPPGAVGDALRSGLHNYEGISGSRSFGFALSSMIEHGGRAHEGRVLAVRPDYFTVLGVRPRQGRTLGAADANPGVASAVISERMAEQLFAKSETPIGGSIVIDGQWFGVVGVMPRGADFCHSCIDAWVVPPSDQIRSIPLNLMRVRPNASLRGLEAELAVLSSRLASAAGVGPGETRFDFRPSLHGQFEFRRFHYAIAAAVLAVLLVVCFNLANMQLARGIGRTRELAMRVALGASRGVLVRQLVIESGLVALGGLAVGLLMTAWGSGLVAASLPKEIGGYVVEPSLSWRVLAFAVVMGMACLVIVGVIPAIRVTRVNLNELLKSGAGTGAHKRNQRQYGPLVIAQIGLALALLSGAGIVSRQAWRIEQVRFGFDLRPLATAWRLFERPRTGAATFSPAANELVGRVRNLPDVADAAAHTRAGPAGHAITVTDPGGMVEHPAAMWSYHIVSPSYLRTVNLPIVVGRDFREGERDVAVAIVDRAMARSLWPNSNAIGSMIKLGELRSTRPWVRVVGIVGEEAEYTTADQSARTPLSANGLGRAYVLGTAADTLWGGKSGVSINLVARASTSPERLPLAMRRALVDLPGTIGLRTSSMATALGYSSLRDRHRFVAAMFVVFAALATALAAIGIYGIVSHSVAERRREIGVRIALGASAGRILRALLREGNVLALAGVAFGLLIVKYTAAWLAAFSLENDQYDAVLFGAMAAGLFAVTVIAALIPALRATRIDPVEALRTD
jgi:predicted permease